MADASVEIRILAALDSSLQVSVAQATTAIDKIASSAREGTSSLSALGEESKRRAGDLNKLAAGPGVEAIAKARQQVAEINENYAIAGQQRLAQDEAVWQGLLQHAKLNAAQIAAVQKEISSDKTQSAREAAREAQEIAKNDAATEVALAKHAFEAKKEMLGQQLADHQITPQVKYEGVIEAINEEMAAEKRAQQEIINDAHATEAEKEAARNRERVIDAEADSERLAAQRQLTQELKAENARRLEDYRSLVSGITSAEGELVDDIFTKRQKLSKDLAQVGQRMVEREVSDDLKSLTEQGFASLGLMDPNKTAGGGMLMTGAEKLFGFGRGAGQAGTEAAQTTAITSNTAAIAALTTALTGHGAVVASNTIATGTHTIAVGANTVSTTANAASTDSNTLATLWNTIAQWAHDLFPFAEGTDYVPRTMPALVHQGEMIIPADQAAVIRAGGGFNAQAIRAGGGSFAGGDTHNHFNFDIDNSSEFHGIDKDDVIGHLTRNPAVLAKALSAVVRSGHWRPNG